MFHCHVIPAMHVLPFAIAYNHYSPHAVQSLAKQGYMLTNSCIF